MSYICLSCSDVKPANILLDSEGNVKLGDFGLAVAQSEKRGGGAGGSSSVAAAAAAAAFAKKVSASGSDGGQPQQLSESDLQSISAGVGTTLYRAPEVMPAEAAAIAPKVLQPAGGAKTTAAKPSAATSSAVIIPPPLAATAPPQAPSHQHHHYDEKADMYSLGIVLFELFHPPFNTLMERARTVMALREGEGKPSSMPPAFVKATPQGVVTLIGMLLARDPASRPTAAQLLSSPLLPHRSELESGYMQEAVAALSAPHSMFFSTLLGRLFSMLTQDYVYLSFDLLDGGGSGAGAGAAAGSSAATAALTDAEEVDVADPFSSASLPLALLASASSLSFVRRLLTRTFERHGAVCIDAPLITPKPSPLSSYAATAFRRVLAAQLIASDGDRLLWNLASTLVPSSTAAPSSSSSSSSQQPSLTPLVASLFHQLQSHLVHALTSAVTAFPPFSPLAIAEAAALAANSAADAAAGKVDSSAANGSSAKLPAQLLDPDGVVTQLPHDLTNPFARWLARRHVSRLKRWSIARVYRRRPNGGAPRELTEAVMDVVWSSPSASIAQSIGSNSRSNVYSDAPSVDAEAVLTAVEAMQGATAALSAFAVPPQSNAYFLRLSNSKILSGLLEALLIPPSLHGAIVHLATGAAAVGLAIENTSPSVVAGKASKSGTASVSEGPLPWPELRNYLINGLGLQQHIADSLRPFVTPPPGGVSGLGLTSQCSSIESFIARQRAALNKRLPLLFGLSTGAAASSTSGRSVLAPGEAVPLLTQLRGLLQMSSGLAELRSLASVLAALADGSTGPLSEVAADGVTADTAPLARSHAVADVYRSLVVDLGMCEPELYHGCVFQVVLRQRSKAANFSDGSSGKGGAPTPLSSTSGKKGGLSAANLMQRAGRPSSTKPASSSSAPAAASVGASVVSVETLAAVDAQLKLGASFAGVCDRDCVARGGRYDALLLRYRDRFEDRSPPPAAAQVRFGVDKLARTISALQASVPAALPPSALGSLPVPARLRFSGLPHGVPATVSAAAALRQLLPACDVLVCNIGDSAPAASSSSGGQSSESAALLRSVIAASLWQAGISAEYLHPPMPSLHDAATHAAVIGAKVLVLAGSSPARLRIRDLTGTLREDAEVPLQEAPQAVLRILASANGALGVGHPFAAPLFVAGGRSGLDAATGGGGAGGSGSGGASAANAAGGVSDRSGTSSSSSSGHLGHHTSGGGLPSSGSSGGGGSGASDAVPSNVSLRFHFVACEALSDATGPQKRHKTSTLEKRAVSRLASSGVLAGASAAAGGGSGGGGHHGYGGSTAGALSTHHVGSRGSGHASSSSSSHHGHGHGHHQARVEVLVTDLPYRLLRDIGTAASAAVSGGGAASAGAASAEAWASLSSRTADKLFTGHKAAAREVLDAVCGLLLGGGGVGGGGGSASHGGGHGSGGTDVSGDKSSGGGGKGGGSAPLTVLYSLADDRVDALF